MKRVAAVQLITCLALASPCTYAADAGADEPGMIAQAVILFIIMMVVTVLFARFISKKASALGEDRKSCLRIFLQVLLTGMGLSFLAACLHVFVMTFMAGL